MTLLVFPRFSWLLAADPPAAASDERRAASGRRKGGGIHAGSQQLRSFPTASLVASVHAPRTRSTRR